MKRLLVIDWFDVLAGLLPVGWWVMCHCVGLLVGGGSFDTPDGVINL